MTREFALAYLAGLIDGEGCVYYEPPPTSIRQIQITNTDKGIMDTCVACCELLEYSHKFSGPHRYGTGAPYWLLTIGRQETMRRLNDEVPLQSARKKAKLEEAISTYRMLPYG